MKSQEFRRMFLRTLPELEKALGKLMMPVLSRAGLTEAEYGVLTGVQSGLVATVGGLVQLTHMGQANVSSLCKRMEAKGLLTRTRSKEDERVVRLSITPEGLRRLAAVEETYGYFDDLLARVPSEDLNAIVSGIAALQRTLAFINNLDEEGVTPCSN